jgi:hypothetical protein
MRWQTILSGVLGLALLEATVSSTDASGRVGQLLTGVAGLISHALSPTVPAIPDLRKRGGAATSTAAPAASGSKPDQSSGGSKTFPADWNTSPTSLFV